MMKTSKFDVADYLHSEEDIQGYLLAVLESGASDKAIKKAFMNAEQARAKLKNQEPNMATVDMIYNALINSNLLRHSALYVN